jgi:sarcosine oxidase
MNTHHFDVIVLGVGSLGSSTCYQLAKRGVRVLGLDQFEVPHEQGSHGGQSRIIRKAYFEHPDYVPLLERAYTLWKSLQDETGEQVYFRTGLLYLGDQGNNLISGVRASSSVYDIDVIEKNRQEFETDHPQFQLPDHYTTLLEPDAGLLLPEKAIRLYVRQAMHHGATIRSSQKVISWKQTDEGVIVVTESETFTANKLVITAGPWAGKLIEGFEDHLVVSRQVMAWVMPKDKSAFVVEKFPCWTLADEEHDSIFYGFPMLSGSGFEGPIGLKLAHHAQGKPTDPDGIDMPPNADDEKLIIDFLHQFMPDAYDHTIAMKTCRYTNSKDENFVLDHLPGYDKVFVATGCSGHAFKFSSVIGEIMADLAMHGKSPLPIGFLNASRLKKN